MRRRAGSIVPLAVILLLTAFAGATGAAKGPGVSAHPVNLLWTPDEQDITPSSPTIIDTFDSSGRPFGAQAVQMLTPRNQMFENTKRGEWALYVRSPRRPQNPGVCRGTFEITKNYLETTATTQTVAYEGKLRIEGCRNTRKFKQVRPGRLGRVTGKSFCTTAGCSGGLKIKGEIRY